MTSIRWILVGLTAVWLVTGCASTPQAQFFMLAEPPATHAAVSGSSDDGPSLAIGPVELPRYLDRPQIVTRGPGNRLLVDEFNRWGGALDEDIQALIAVRIGQRLGNQRIYGYPSRIVAATDYRVALDIRRFEGALGGVVELDLAWSIIDDRTAEVLSVRRATFVATAAGPDYAAYVAALSEVLGQFADRLADDLAGRTQRR